MAITRHNKHNNCPVVAVKVTSDNCPHYAKLCCKRHKKHIQWLSKAQYEAILCMYPDTYGQNGVKERPTRRLSKQEYTMQYKNGHLWDNAYSFEQ